MEFIESSKAKTVCICIITIITASVLCAVFASQAIYCNIVANKGTYNFFDRFIIKIASLQGNPSANFDDALYTCSIKSNQECLEIMQRVSQYGHPFSFYFIAKKLDATDGSTSLIKVYLEYFTRLQQKFPPIPNSQARHLEFSLMQQDALKMLQDIDTQFIPDNQDQENEVIDLKEKQSVWNAYCSHQTKDPYCDFYTE